MQVSKEQVATGVPQTTTITQSAPSATPLPHAQNTARAAPKGTASANINIMGRRVPLDAVFRVVMELAPLTLRSSVFVTPVILPIIMVSVRSAQPAITFPTAVSIAYPTRRVTVTVVATPLGSAHAIKGSWVRRVLNARRTTGGIQNASPANVPVTELVTAPPAVSATRGSRVRLAPNARRTIEAPGQTATSATPRLIAAVTELVAARATVSATRGSGVLGAICARITIMDIRHANTA